MVTISRQAYVKNAPKYTIFTPHRHGPPNKDSGCGTDRTCHVTSTKFGRTLTLIWQWHPIFWDVWSGVPHGVQRSPDYPPGSSHTLWWSLTSGWRCVLQLINPLASLLHADTHHSCNPFKSSDQLASHCTLQNIDDKNNQKTKDTPGCVLRGGR